jgi:hypothetical protein
MDVFEQKQNEKFERDRAEAERIAAAIAAEKELDEQDR